MELTVNYVAIFVAALAAVMVGAAWYSPKALGTPWVRLAGIKRGPKPSTERMIVLVVAAFVLSYITAFGLAHFIAIANLWFSVSYLALAIATGFWVWVSFVASRIYLHDMFEGRPRNLSLLTLSHELSAIMVMAIVIGLFGV